MIQRLINLIKTCFVTTVTNDNKGYSLLEVSHDEAINTVAQLTPYGLYCNPPENATGIIWLVGGEASKGVAMVNVDAERFKNLLRGEVCIGNPLTLSNILFDKDGNIIGIVKKDFTLTITGDNNISIDGEFTVNASGNANIISTQEVNITAPIVKISNNGMTDNLVKFSDLQEWADSHVHPDPVSGLTGVSTTTLPLTAKTSVVQGE